MLKLCGLESRELKERVFWGKRGGEMSGGLRFGPGCVIVRKGGRIRMEVS